LSFYRRKYFRTKFSKKKKKIKLNFLKDQIKLESVSSSRIFCNLIK
jgi:hypothetical protein